MLVVLPEMWNCPYSADYFAKHAEDFDNKDTLPAFPCYLKLHFVTTSQSLVGQCLNGVMAACIILVASLDQMGSSRLGIGKYIYLILTFWERYHSRNRTPLEPVMNLYSGHRCWSYWNKDLP